MASISPKNATWINTAIIIGGVIVSYAATTDLPPPWPHEWSEVIKAQATYLEGMGKALMGAGVVNAVLSALSSNDSGPLTKFLDRN